MTSKWYDEFYKKLSEGKDLTKEELQDAIQNKGFDINEKNKYGWTLCMRAVQQGKIETVKMLVKELKANINAQDKGGWSACVHAVVYDQKETLFELVRLGANIFIKDYDKKNMFDYIEDDETIEEVIKLRREYEQNHPKAKKIANTLTQRYFYNKFKNKLLNDEELTEEELQEAINLGFDINATNKEGTTLCMWAAIKGKTKTVRVLKKQGANIDAQDKDGWTACMCAAVRGNTDTVRVLVNELKADIDAQNKDGRTACMCAARNCKTDTLLELVRLGADISIKDNDKKDLFDCIDDDKIKKEVIKLRKEYEENHPEAKKMAASFASRYFYDKFVKKLLDGKELTKEELQKAIDQGFDINATDKDGLGWTLCMRAVQQGKIETVKILVKELNANINAQDKDGRTACMWAATGNHMAILFELVRLGADISIESNFGNTLFDYYIGDKTIEEVIGLRKEYENAHPKAQKMADTLTQRYFYNKFTRKLLDGKELTKEELQEAIGKGFDINAKDKDGTTLCMRAAENGKTDTLLELVRLGANLSIKDNNGKKLFGYIEDDETRKKVIAARKEYLKTQRKKTPVKPVNTPQNGQETREKGVAADKKDHVK